MPIKMTTTGSFKKTRRFLKHASDKKILKSLRKYAREGVVALMSATPIDSGSTASMWRYEIAYADGSARINWVNDNVNDGVNIALILQLGHGTGTGGWVEGRDYINPAIQPVFDEMTNKIWKEVTSG
mgnify:FL=1